MPRLLVVLDQAFTEPGTDNYSGFIVANTSVAVYSTSKQSMITLIARKMKEKNIGQFMQKW